MNWINVTVSIYDDNGLCAASVSGDLEQVVKSIVCSLGNKDLPKSHYDALLNGDISCISCQAVTDRLPKIEVASTLHISVKTFLDMSFKKFVKLLLSTLVNHGDFVFRPYADIYKESSLGVLKEFNYEQTSFA